MRALRYERFGDPAEVVHAVDVPVPDVPPGQVRLKMHRAAIHNHDLATIKGVYGYKPALPAIGGTEFAGVVDAAGEGVAHLQPGMRVAAMTANSAWAEYVVAHGMAAVPVPDAIPDEMAAQLMAMPMSAIVMFDEMHVEPGMWIAQTAAGGAVGRIVMRLAQDAGVNIINIVRSERAAQELRELGATHVVVTKEDGAWQREVRELTGGAGLARILDSVAGAQTLDLQRLLAPHGELIIFGGLSGAPVKLDPSLMISLECVVRGFWMSSWMLRATTEQRMATMQRVFEMALRGALPLPVSGVYPLDDCASALRAAETPGRAGKVLFSA